MHTSLCSVLLILCSSVALGLVLPQRKSYAGHSVWKVHVESHDHVKFLTSLEKEYGMRLDFWREVRRVPGSADVRVSPEDKPTLKKLLYKQGMKMEVKIEDVDNMIQAEFDSLKKRTIFKEGDHPSKLTIDQWHSYTEIIAYLTSVASQYSTFASKFLIGNSYENRQQSGVKIGNPTGNNKPAVYIEGTIHAREWLATNTMLYIIDQLTNNATAYKSLLDAIDVYVVPIANPDGYDYTWTNDRMWRKTRSGPRNGCYGVDPNRNWNFKWGVAGYSRDPCSEEYDGPSPGSEVEVQNLQKYLASNPNLKSVFDIHTYSEDFMYPYGYAEVYPPDVAKIKALAGKATAAVNAVNGENFVYGSIIDIVYPASGSSIDYTRGVLNIDYSYAMELRPSGDAFNGFVISEDQIIPGASEAWAGIQMVFQQVASGQ